jgi:hypothetical protein
MPTLNSLFAPGNMNRQVPGVVSDLNEEIS